MEAEEWKRRNCHATGNGKLSPREHLSLFDEEKFVKRFRSAYCSAESESRAERPLHSNPFNRAAEANPV